MRKIQIILILTLVLAAPVGVNAQGEHIFLIKAFDCAAGPKNRTQSGFRVRGHKGIISALHGVAGCAIVKAQTNKGPILSAELSVAAVDIEKDVVLLTSEEIKAQSDDGLRVAKTVSLTPLQNVKVTGHPYGIDSLNSQLILRDPPLKTLRDLLTEEALGALRARRSPAPTISVLSLQGPIAPGDSGAPIFDSNGEVIAVANGGLFGGATDITWAIPLLDVQWAVVNSASRDSVRRIGSMNSNSLFSFDKNVPPKFPLTLTDEKEFSKGHMRTSFLVGPDGRLIADTFTRGTANLDGFCGNVTFWFFDADGNNIGVYGMGKDHQWCVGSGVESTFGGGARVRNDHQALTVPKDVINRTAAVAIFHIEGPGKSTADLLSQFLNHATELKKPVEQ